MGAGDTTETLRPQDCLTAASESPSRPKNTIRSVSFGSNRRSNNEHESRTHFEHADPVQICASIDLSHDRHESTPNLVGKNTVALGSRRVVACQVFTKQAWHSIQPPVPTRCDHV
eukprot:970184-Rhodomonas_salina.1